MSLASFYVWVLSRIHSKWHNHSTVLRANMALMTEVVMPKDFRLEFINNVERSLVSILDRNTFNEVIQNVTCVLNDYEIFERSTELVVVDGLNERLIKRFAATGYVNGLARRSVEQYVSAVRKMLGVIPKNLTEVSAYDIRYYLALLKSENSVSNRTLENYRSFLSTFFKWMYSEEIIQRNPFDNIRPIKYKEEIRLPYSDVDIDRLRGACTTVRERALIEVLLSTGMRIEECVSVNKTDVNIHNTSIVVKNGKGGKERTVYFNDVAMSYIVEIFDEPGIQLFSSNNGRLTTGGARWILKNIANRAGVDNVHPHRFRRTFATRLYNRGMDLTKIQQLMGHSNPSTTMGYIATDMVNVSNTYKKYSG